MNEIPLYLHAEANVLKFLNKKIRKLVGIKFDATCVGR